MQQNKFDDFTVVANVETVTISRNGSVSFRPGEAGTLTGILSIALRMENLPVLPSHIDNPPFRVNFTEDDALQVNRLDDQQVPLDLGWNEVDKFMQVVGEAVKISINDTTLNSNVNRHSATNPTDPDAPYID